MFERISAEHNDMLVKFIKEKNEALLKSKLIFSKLCWLFLGNEKAGIVSPGKKDGLNTNYVSIKDKQILII